MERLDDMLVNIMGYDPEREWVLEDVARCIKYLPNNEVAIDVQISNNIGIDTQRVEDYITTEDFDLVLYMFQVTELMSEEEYKALKIIVINDKHI